MPLERKGRNLPRGLRPLVGDLEHIRKGSGSYRLRSLFNFLRVVPTYKLMLKIWYLGFGFRGLC